jgi:hypothetical protein
MNVSDQPRDQVSDRDGSVDGWQGFGALDDQLFLLPPIRPSSAALLGLAWKKQSPPAVAAARQGLPLFV